MTINVLAIVAIFVFAGIMLSVSVEGLMIPILIFIVGGIFQLINTLDFRKYVVSTQEIEELPSVMDAVEEHRTPMLRRYLRFSKDGKWGLYDVTLRRVVLKPVYDQIVWKKTGHTLLVTRDGERQQVRLGRFKGNLKFEDGGCS